MNYVSGVRCYHCHKTWDISQISYLCPECQGNLEVLYDYKKIRKVLNYKYFQGNRDYSIWRYTPLLPVENQNELPLQIGFTPLYKIRSTTKVNLYLKDDGRNPSASFKDRASAIALLHARHNGHKQVTGASTGNAGSSMACLAASVGMPAIIFVPCKAPQAKIAQLLIFGAKVITVNGTYDDAFNLCMEFSKETGWYCRNTGYNPYTREGKKTCAFEICEQLGWKVPDWVLVSVGDGNIISGLWKGFRELKEVGLIDRLPQMAGIQSTQSNAISQSVQKVRSGGKLEIVTVQATTLADSISVDFPRDGIAGAQAILESNGLAVEVTDEEILAAIAKAGKTWGIFGEPAGIASVAGLQKMEQSGLLREGETVVCVVTGNGLKDVASAIKAAGSPILIEPTLAEAKRVLL